MKTLFSILSLFCLSLIGYSQTGTLSGKVTDNVTKQPVVGAKLFISSQFRAISDPDGKYELSNLPYGTYQLVVSMPSFDTLKLAVKIDKPLVTNNIILGGSTELEEVKVIGNLANDRRTPVAVSRLSTQKIAEELGSRDLPMLLNATPGVYATQTGGGDGDARINVRGFDQRNVGVLIDGVPVNDMENGWVYWSNWFGLDAITASMQVQRGLGATKLAMPSVGGTINILTQGAGNKKGLTFKQEYGTGNFLRTSLSYNSGMNSKGWGLTFSGSYKQSDGWVYGTPSQGAFGYMKVQKKIKSHLISLSAFAAPQQHGQRSFKQQIQYWDTTNARNQGIIIDTNAIFLNEGVRFNQHWGYRTIDGKRQVQNEVLNYYNKPQFTLKDFWKVNDKLSISNIAYVSIGRGGGTRLSNSAVLRDSTNLIDWDQIVNENQVSSLFGTPNIDPIYSPSLIKSSQILLNSVNNHFWAGYLGQFSYNYSKSLSISGGLDYRYYKGSHYQEIRDLLGGDYYIETSNKNDADPMKVVGDKIAMKPFNNYRDAFVNWMGVFGQAEYTGEKWTGFINLSGIVNGYKGVDYFQKKVLTVGDTVLRLGVNDTISYNGQTYTQNSAGVQFFQTDWKYLPGMTIKVGGSYSLTDNATVYMNTGYLNRTPQFSNVIDNSTNTFFKEILNEKILALEGGCNYADEIFGLNLNGYFTNWQNKPFPYGVSVPDPQDPTETVAININGMDAIHVGGELDMACKFNKKWSGELMFSYGNWIWNSSQTVYVAQYDYSLTFDAKGVHVGDAAQTSFAIAARYEPFKSTYFKVQFQYFDRYYSNFNPFFLQGANGGREAWMIPSYYLMNLFAGHKVDLKKYDLLFSGNITNLTDIGSLFGSSKLRNNFIADASDNGNAPYNDSNAQSATVMFGGGFRFNLSIALQF